MGKTLLAESDSMNLIGLLKGHADMILYWVMSDPSVAIKGSDFISDWFDCILIRHIYLP